MEWKIYERVRFFEWISWQYLRRHASSEPKVHPPLSIESELRPISLTATIAKLLESFVK